MYFFYLHLAAYTIAEFFDAFAILVRHDVFDEGVYSSFRIFAGINVFIAPYSVRAIIGVFQGWGDAVDSNRTYAVIVDDVRKCYIADGTRILSDALYEDTGVICFKSLVRGFFCIAKSIFLIKSTCTRCLRTGYENDFSSGPPTSFQFVIFAVKIS